VICNIFCIIVWQSLEDNTVTFLNSGHLETSKVGVYNSELCTVLHVQQWETLWLIFKMGKQRI